MVDAPMLLPEGAPDDKTRRGYVMVATAATLFAVNGSVSKVVLGSGLSSLELAQIRNTCAAILFFAFLLARGAVASEGRAARTALPRRVRPHRHRTRAVALLRRDREPPGRRRAAHRVHRAALRRALRTLRLRRARSATHLGLRRDVPDGPRARGGALVRRRVQYRRRHRGVRRRAGADGVSPHGRTRAPAPRRRFALVLRLPLRSAALGRDPAALGLPVERSRRERLAAGEPVRVLGARLGARQRSSSSSGRWSPSRCSRDLSGTSARRAPLSWPRSSLSSRPSLRGPGWERRSGRRSSSAVPS